MHAYRPYTHEHTQARAATATELHAKFVQQGDAFTLSFGGLKTFYGGLEGLVGVPNPLVLPTMEAEHSARADSASPFRTSNYGLQTCSRVEWTFVVEPDADGVLARLGIECWPCEEASAAGAHPRAPTPLAELDGARAAVDARLAAHDTEALQTAELVAARLYTGPMFAKYNAVLRARTGVDALARQCEELCQGNGYTTTLHAVNSAIVKLGKVTTAEKVYRGVTNM